MILAKKIVSAGRKALRCDGYNIVQNNGEAADRQCSISIYMLFPDIQGTTQG